MGNRQVDDSLFTSRPGRLALQSILLLLLKLVYLAKIHKPVESAGYLSSSSDCCYLILLLAGVIAVLNTHIYIYILFLHQGARCLPESHLDSSKLD